MRGSPGPSAWLNEHQPRALGRHQRAALLLAAPAALLALAAGSDSGHSGSDDLTNVQMPTIQTAAGISAMKTISPGDQLITEIQGLEAPKRKMGAF